MSNEEQSLEQRVEALEQQVRRLKAALATADQWRIERNRASGHGGFGEKHSLNVGPLMRALADEA